MKHPKQNRRRNNLEKELRQLSIEERPLNTPNDDPDPHELYASNEDIVSIWLHDYRMKCAVEDARVDEFFSLYLDWLNFYVPAVKELERSTPRSRGTTDQALSQLWEKALIEYRPRLQELQERAEEASIVYRKRLGSTYSSMSETVVDSPVSDDSEDSRWSSSTMPGDVV